MLNDDDKKYLKQIIEKRLSNIEKGIANFAANNVSKPSELNQYSMRSLALDREQHAKEDRDVLIEKLQDLQDKGDATLAQKMELIRLSVDRAVPQDFKDGVAVMSATMKKGANQAMGGVNHLTGRLMYSNPITAMLWRNRDIAKAMWDVGAGTLKMGFGAVTGLARGAGGLVNSAINLAKKKTNKTNKNEEVEENSEETISDTTSEQISKLSEEEFEQEESDKEKETTAQRVLELHQYFLKGKFDKKQDTVEKSRNSILSSGLASLGKTMKAVGGFVELIQAKQKLILSGLLLGGLAILGLAAWFKSGGLEALLAKWNHTAEHNEKGKVRTDQISSIMTSSFLSGSDLTKVITPEVRSQFGSVTSGKLSTKTVQKVSSEGIPYNVIKAQYDMQVDGRTPVLAPFDGTCTSYRILTNIEGGDEKNKRVEITIKPTKKDSWTAGEEAQRRYYGGLQDHSLTYHNLVEPHVAKDTKFSKGYPLGFADEDFYVTGNSGYGEQDIGILQHYLGNTVEEYKQAKSENYDKAFSILQNEKTDKVVSELKDQTVLATRRSGYALNTGFWDNVGDVLDRAKYHFKEGYKEELYSTITDSGKSFSATGVAKDQNPNRIIDKRLVTPEDATKKGFIEQTTENINKFADSSKQYAQEYEEERKAKQKGTEDTYSSNVQEGRRFVLPDQTNQSKPTVSVNQKTSTPSREAEYMNMGQATLATKGITIC